MAQKTQVIYVDDLSGDVLPEGEGQTVSFGLDGTSYEIDLNREHADELRDVFKKYVQAARRVGRQSTGRRTASTRRDLRAIRDWAREHGHEVSERGRIPKAVSEAYDVAH